MSDISEQLSRIQTCWSKLLAPGAAGQQDLWQQELLMRYYRAAFRYLIGITKSPDVAEELAQDFAVRFMRGDFRKLDQERGRFRDFLKTVLRNLCRDHWRKQQRAKEVQSEGDGPLEPPAPDVESDASFDESWREELLAKTWEALAEVERASGKPYFTALSVKVQEPTLRSPELAERLGKALGRTIRADALRQILHRARETFGNLLLSEVESTLESRDPERLAEELGELGLLDYCRSALQTRKQADA
jgi:RNA polymerase sigma-70 factor (ECF subfamily)